MWNAGLDESQAGIKIVCVLSHVWLFATPWTVACQALCPWNFPVKNAGVGCHFLLQGIFPTQGLNTSLLNSQAVSSPLSHQGNPDKIPDMLFNSQTTLRMRASLVAQMVIRLPAMQETQVQSLGLEDPLENEMATHSSTLVWKIPWTEEPGRLQSMGSQRVGHDWANSLSLFSFNNVLYVFPMVLHIYNYNLVPNFCAIICLLIQLFLDMYLGSNFLLL